MNRVNLPPRRRRPMTVVEMARLGGLACARSRSPEERHRIAVHAINERWRRYRERLGLQTTEEPSAG